MRNRVFKRLAAAAVAAAMLSSAALAAPADDLKTAANKSNLLRQGSAQTVTATAEGAAVTVNDLALPSGCKTNETVTVLVESDGNIRYILGSVSGGKVSAAYQENGADSFTMLAAQGAIDQGSLTVTSSAAKNDGGYAVTYTAKLTMSDDLAILAAENRTDSARLKALRFTCVLEDDLLTQLDSVSAKDVAIQGNSCFELVSTEVTDAGISIVYKLVESVVDSWKTATVTLTDVRKQLQQPMTISCTKNASTAQVTDAQNSTGEIYTYGALAITYEPNDRPVVIPTLDNAVQVVVPGKLAKMTFDESWANPYIDVAEGSWYYDAVKYVTENGLMGGAGSADTFQPAMTTTRGMIMTILARMNGVDTTGSTPWYQKGMEWALSAGVSDGTAPDRDISRQELATMLWRYVGSPASSQSLSAFADADQVASWAETAMRWAVETGLFEGNEKGQLTPADTATRMEVATILMRFCENIAK